MSKQVSISAATRSVRILRRTLNPHRFFSTSEEPFYGSPRPQTNHRQRLPHQKLALAIHHATTAFADPTRADAVAALGELTGQVSLERIHKQMMADPTGQRILEDRPVVSKATIPYEQLMQNIPEDPEEPLTFGQAYGKFLKSHGFDPDERDPVKYIENETLAYIMLRYRQVSPSSLDKALHLIDSCTSINSRIMISGMPSQDSLPLSWVS